MPSLLAIWDGYDIEEICLWEDSIPDASELAEELDLYLNQALGVYDNNHLTALTKSLISTGQGDYGENYRFVFLRPSTTKSTFHCVPGEDLFPAYEYGEDVEAYWESNEEPVKIDVYELLQPVYAVPTLDGYYETYSTLEGANKANEKYKKERRKND